jgi:hypothetical protein
VYVVRQPHDYKGFHAASIGPGRSLSHKRAA